MNKKHLPTRTCIACRKIRLKQDMIRIVRHPDGTVGIDSTGKANGRGGYLCQHFYCWQRALRRRASVLKYALKAELDIKTVKELKQFGKQYMRENKIKDENAKEGENKADNETNNTNEAGSTEQTENKSTEQTENQSTEQTENKSKEQTENQSKDQGQDNSEDKTENKTKNDA